MFTVTRKWLHRHKVNRGCWSVAQFQQLGFPSSPKAGWIKLICGKQITLDAKAAFEALGSGAQKNPRKARTKSGATGAKSILRAGVDVKSDAFLQTYEWRVLRMKVLKHYGARCMCCGATPSGGAVMNVDHIKPRRDFPHLALDFDNLQVLCHECNHGKGNWDRTDWRPAELSDSLTQETAHLKSISQDPPW